MSNQSTKTVLMVIAAWVALIALPSLGHADKITDFIVFASAYGLLAMGLNLLIGYTGLISFGHAMFFASGAYGFGALMQSGAFAVPVAFLLSIGITSAIALLVGAICVRLSEIYFAFLTLAFQMFFHSILLSWVEVTGGDNGLLGGIPTPVFFGVDLSNHTHLYVFCVTVTLISIFIMHRIVNSPFGYTLRMIRDNERRAIYLGVNVFAIKLTCFVLSAVFSSVGGIIMALFVSGAYPDFAFWTTSGEAIFMVMLGGVTHFLGPLLGAVILTGLNDVVITYTDHYGLFLGSIILIFALVLRKGVLDFVQPHRKRSKTKSKTSAEGTSHAET